MLSMAKHWSKVKPKKGQYEKVSCNPPESLCCKNLVLEDFQEHFYHSRKLLYYLNCYVEN